MDNSVQMGRSVVEHQAPIDNRNYMTFYTLERLLLRIVEQDMNRATGQRAINNLNDHL